MRAPILLALDIGGTKLMVAAADEHGQIVRRARAGTPGDLNEGIALLKHMAHDVAAGKRVIAIGASAGGPLDWRTGVISPLHQPEWRNVPLGDIFSREFKCPLRVEGRVRRETSCRRAKSVIIKRSSTRLSINF